MTSGATPQADASDQDPPPPRVYPRLNRRLAIAMWLAVAGGLVMLGGGAYEFWRANRLRVHGVRTAGTVQEGTRLATGKGRTACQLLVDYTPEGSPTTYRRQFSVDEAEYDAALATGEVSVVYLPSEPELAALGEKVMPNGEALAIGAGLLAAAGGIAWYRRRQWRRVETYIRGEASAPAGGTS